MRHDHEAELGDVAGDHVDGSDVDQTVGDRDQLEIAELDLGAGLLVGLQAQLGADVLLGFGLVGDSKGPGWQRILVDQVGHQLAVVLGIAGSGHVGLEFGAPVVGGERHERAQDHELVLTGGGVLEHRVVRHEPLDIRLGGELGLHIGRVGRCADDPAGVLPVDRRRLGDRPGTGALEEVGRGDLVLGVQVGLDPEQVFGVAQVFGQFGRHVGPVGEQVGERRAPRLQDRVGVVDHIEGHVTGVGVDHCLDAVADVVGAARQPGRSAELHVADPLGVGVPTRRGVGIDHPLHTAVDHDRVRVAVVVEERSQLGDPVLDLTDPQHLRVTVDRSGSDHVVVEERQREGGLAGEPRELDSGGARVLGGFAALALGHRGAGDRVAADVGTEVQLGPGQVDGLIVGPVTIGDPSDRRQDQPAAAGAHEVLALPTLVGNVAEVEFASGDQHLFAGAVDLVAVDVEVGDLEPGDLAAVDREARQHLARVEQSNVADRIEIGFDLLRREPLETDRPLDDIADAHRRPGRLDVAGDVDRLAFFLVGLDDERLHDRRVDQATDDEHDQPQARRHQRKPPLVGADRRQVQQRREQGDQDQQHHRRQLCVDHAVGGALHEPSGFVGQFVPGQPVVGGLHRGQQGEQHGHVGLGGGTHGRGRRREQHAAVQEVGGEREQRHHDERREQPVDGERDERQLEDVEPDVDVELGVLDTERLAVAEQQPVLPPRHRRKGEHDRQHERRAVPHQPQTLPEHLVEAFDVGVHVGRELGRGGSVGHVQVEPRQDQEHQEEQEEQGRFGADLAPEHVGATERLVPQRVDVEAGDRPAEHHDQEEQQAEHDQHHPTVDSGTGP